MPRLGGSPVPGSFAELVEEFYKSDHFKGLARSTQASYTRYLGIASRPAVLGDKMVMELCTPMVQQFLNCLGHVPGAQEQARTAIKSLEKWALPNGHIRLPFSYGVQIIGSDGHHQPWTHEEVEHAIKHARPDIARVILLAAHTGQRGSDLCKMKWSEVEEVDGYPGINVVQQKTGRKLWVPFSPELTAALAGWERRVPDFLLISQAGRPWPNRHTMSEAWVDERDRNPSLKAHAGLVLHGLRGHAVVKLRRAGATPLQIADAVGMSVPMIENYCKLANQKKSAMGLVHFMNWGADIRPKKVAPSKLKD